MHFQKAAMTKMTVKQILGQLDYLEILIALGEPAQSIRAMLVYWFDDLRRHLHRLEEMNDLAIN